MLFRYLKSGYDKVRHALSHTRSMLGDRLRTLLGRKVDDELMEDLEELFYEADLGVKTSVQLAEHIRDLYKEDPSLDVEKALQEVQKQLISTLSSGQTDLNEAPQGSPTIILVVGANGNGKTTSIAKIAKRLRGEGKRVLLVAGDTFRAAAVEQLGLWAERVGVDIVRGQMNSDPSAVVFDALESARSRGHDVVLIDTAGRLQTKLPLMQELEKMKRTCRKIVPDSPHETLLVLDTSIGQNAIDQAKTFNQYTPISGLVLTKLDGSAKGGIVVSISQELHIPVKFIGVGEGEDDLQPFDASEFVQALFA
jgi:fused signal recognition particle receptor